MIQEIVEQIGEMSPLYFVVITSYFLYANKRQYYLGGYFVFLILNELVNYILKDTIREKRPMYEDKYEYEGSPLIGNLVRIQPNKYGMPSNHMQNLLFSSIYLYCVIQNSHILIIELFVISIVFYYRYITQKHTIPQLLVGSLIGGFVGYLSFMVIKQYLYHRSIFGEKIFSL